MTKSYPLDNRVQSKPNYSQASDCQSELWDDPVGPLEAPSDEPESLTPDGSPEPAGVLADLADASDGEKDVESHVEAARAVFEPKEYHNLRQKNICSKRIWVHVTTANGVRS